MNSPFWNFSLAVYGVTAVQDECLELQDRFDFDVNLVLFCAYLGAAHGAALPADDVASARDAVREWHGAIAKPLRSARRKLKTIGLPDAQEAAAAMQLRAQVKAAEFESERIEQMMLERWAERRLPAWPHGKTSEAIVANLRTLFATYAVYLEPSSAAKQLIAAALSATAIR